MAYGTRAVTLYDAFSIAYLDRADTSTFQFFNVCHILIVGQDNIHVLCSEFRTQRKWRKECRKANSVLTTPWFWRISTSKKNDSYRIKIMSNIVSTNQRTSSSAPLATYWLSHTTWSSSSVIVRAVQVKEKFTQVASSTERHDK